MVTKDKMPECDVATTVEIIGSKWKTLIIRDLMTGAKRNTELKHSLQG
ncbi:winged helix-turn-helix transcriptional regulator, partial [Listeria innocua]